MCGILAYFSNSNSLSLHSFIQDLKKLHHRGQDSVGISYFYEGKLNFISCKTFNSLLQKVNNIKSKSILGHTKYTTSGAKNNSVDQPLYSTNKFGDYCLIYNGNIPEYENSKEFTNDTMMIIDYLNNKSNNEEFDNWKSLIESFVENYERAFNIIIQTKDTFYIFKDRYGVRPLSYTFYKNSNTYTFSSESRVFQKGQFISEVTAGTLYGLNKYGFKELYSYPNLFQKHCLFEYIYFLNKDSVFEKTFIVNYRKEIGYLMAKRDKNYFDNLKQNIEGEFVVCGVPNTGNDYAVSYANKLGIPYKNYVLKNNEVSRTFILSNDEERNKYANKKYLFDKNLKNKNLILIDDSIVRGITLKNLIRNLKDFGVLNIFIIIASPPINNTCNYGIDIPTKEELIINKIPEKELRTFFGCEKVKYLDLDLLFEALPDYFNKCTMCLKSDPNLEW